MSISIDNSNVLLFTCSMKGNENSINSGGHYKQNIINDNNRHIYDIQTLHLSGRCNFGAMRPDNWSFTVYAYLLDIFKLKVHNSFTRVYPLKNHFVYLMQTTLFKMGNIV